MYSKEVLSLLTVFLTTTNALLLTCDSVLNLPQDKNLTQTEWLSIPAEEVVKCLPELGKKKLDKVEATIIWNAVVRYHTDISNISNEILASLDQVTKGIKPEDYKYIPLSDPDVISNFGNYYNLSNNQLSALANRSRCQFKQPEDYTGYDLMALKQILCAFPLQDIQKIKPKAYKDAAFVIGRLQDCDFNVLQGFVNLAIEKEAFGPPDNWRRETICIMGVVAKYLPLNTTLKLMKELGSDFLKESKRIVKEESSCYED